MHEYHFFNGIFRNDVAGCAWLSDLDRDGWEAVSIVRAVMHSGIEYQVVAKTVPRTDVVPESEMGKRVAFLREIMRHIGGLSDTSATVVDGPVKSRALKLAKELLLTINANAADALKYGTDARDMRRPSTFGCEFIRDQIDQADRLGRPAPAPTHFTGLADPAAITEIKMVGGVPCRRIGPATSAAHASEIRRAGGRFTMERKRRITKRIWWMPVRLETKQSGIRIATGADLEKIQDAIRTRRKTMGVPKGELDRGLDAPAIKGRARIPRKKRK